MTGKRRGTHQKNGIFPETSTNNHLNITARIRRFNFNNPEFLYQSFTHSSYVNEHRRKLYTDNERLEFLGDAVLRTVRLSIFISKVYLI